MVFVYDLIFGYIVFFFGIMEEIRYNAIISIRGEKPITQVLEITPISLLRFGRLVWHPVSIQPIATCFKRIYISITSDDSKLSKFRVCCDRRCGYSLE